MKRIVLRPGMIKGINTSTDPLAIPDQLLAYGQNLRLSLGPAQARPGDARVSAGVGPGNGILRGSFASYQDGTPSWFVAIASGGYVNILASTDGGVTWTVITPDGATPATSYYGDTRLTDSSTEPVRFCMVKDRPFESTPSYDLLFIQNGIDAPRVYGKGVASGSDIPVFSTTFPGTYGMAVVTQPAQPANDGNLTAYTGFENSFPLGNYTELGTPTTTPSSDAGISITSQTVSSDINWVELLINGSGDGTPYVVGNSATQPVTGDIDASNSQQLVVIGTCADDADWATKLVISVSDGVTPVTIYDPSVGSQIPSQIQVGKDVSQNGRQVAYALPSNTNINWFEVNSVTFGYSEVPDSDLAIELYAVAFGGKTEGGANFAVSYISADTRQEGPAQIITSKQNGSLNLAGGMNNSVNLSLVVNDITIAEDPRFWYDYLVVASVPSDDQTAAGIDFAQLYINEYGTVGYYYVASEHLARWDTGTHAWVSIWAGFSAFSFERPLANVRDQSKPMLASDKICTQIGTAMCTASSRFFVASDARCWYSQVDRPFCFSLSASFDGDPLSSSSFTLDGQSIQVFAVIGSLSGAAESLNTPVVGSATILMLTNMNAFSLSGFDALSLNRPFEEAPYGTLSPLSLARSRFGFYWRDQYGQVQFFDGKLRTLSWNIVDDQTVPVPPARVPWVTGACAYNRFFMGYSRAGQSLNSQSLVWNEVLNEWESIDTGAFTFDCLTPFYNPDIGSVGMYCFASGTVSTPVTLWSYGLAGETANVNFSLSFRALTAGDVKGEPFVQRLNGSAMGVLMENLSGADMTVTTVRTVRKPIAGDSSPTDGSLVIPAATELAWQIDALGVGAEGVSIQPGISATVPGGSSLFMVYIDIDAKMEGVQRV